MLNGIAYIALIAIWSTTPLAIKIGSTELSFAGAIFWRIALSAVLALVLLKVSGKTLFFRAGIWRFYAIAAIGIAPNFLLVYWSSLWIPSGLISVIFSLTPFLMGILSHYWLGKSVFTPQRLLALFIALAGLLVIFADQFVLIGSESIYGIGAMLLSVISFSISSTWLQKVGAQMSPLQMTTGGLWFSIPLLAVFWYWLDGQFPWSISYPGMISIIYLGVVGSLLGFFLYYFLLQRISAYVVSTVGMISPVFALMLGAWIADETLTSRLLWGAGMVLFGLALYHAQAYKRQRTIKEVI